MRSILAVVAIAGAAMIGSLSRTDAADAISVRDLLSACRKSADLCGQVLANNSVSMAFMWNNCIPKDLTTLQRDRAVLRWLAAHPDLSLEDAGDGVADAADALWPCATGQ
ncbi:MAG TPA: Rap1a/Tai family immunity protein [Candidatus Udaeobacter sp.]|nr:Rap1a/Tai family immunity protein [Candidatus Udaeobacter sp.]